MLLDPVVAGGTEEAQHERVVQRLDLVRDAGGNVKHFALPQRHLFARHHQFQSALEHIRHLLALVRVLGNDGAPFQVNLSDGLPFSGHKLSGDHLGDLLEGNFVPAEQVIRLQCGGKAASTAVLRWNYNTRSDI